jgi:hypothetical protein
VEEKQEMPRLVKGGEDGFFFLEMGRWLTYLVRTDKAEVKHGKKVHGFGMIRDALDE